MNNEFLKTVYVVKKRCAEGTKGKKYVYLANNRGAHFMLCYYPLTMNDFHLLPSKANKRKNATRLTSIVCSELLKRSYNERFMDNYKVYKLCLTSKLSIKDAKKKLNTKKARKNRFLIQKISTDWTYNPNNVNEYYPEWQLAEPINLEQAIKIAVAMERLDNTKCRILMTGWRKLTKREVEQLVAWH